MRRESAPVLDAGGGEGDRRGGDGDGDDCLALRSFAPILGAVGAAEYSAKLQEPVEKLLKKCPEAVVRAVACLASGLSTGSSSSRSRSRSSNKEEDGGDAGAFLKGVAPALLKLATSKSARSEDSKDDALRALHGVPRRVHGVRDKMCKVRTGCRFLTLYWAVKFSPRHCHSVDVC